MDTSYLSIKISALAPLIVIWDFVCNPLVKLSSHTILIIQIIMLFILSPILIVGFSALIILRVSTFFEKLLSSSIEYKADNYAVMLTCDDGLPNFFNFIAPYDVPPQNTFMASYTASHPATELRHDKASKVLQEINC